MKEKPKPKTKKTGGRPRKEIDKEQFEKLCGLQCTKDEIADFLEVSPDTLERWAKREYGVNFAVVWRQKREKGRVSLRRAGFVLAQKNAAVHIFYAKNFLGMTDVYIAEKREGQLAQLIDGLKQPEVIYTVEADDLHTETVESNEVVAEQPPKEDKHT